MTDANIGHSRPRETSLGEPPRAAYSGAVDQEREAAREQATAFLRDLDGLDVSNAPEPVQLAAGLLAGCVSDTEALVRQMEAHRASAGRHLRPILEGAVKALYLLRDGDLASRRLAKASWTGLERWRSAVGEETVPPEDLERVAAREPDLYSLCCSAESWLERRALAVSFVDLYAVVARRSNLLYQHPGFGSANSHIIRSDSGICVTTESDPRWHATDRDAYLMADVLCDVALAVQTAIEGR